MAEESREDRVWRQLNETKVLQLGTSLNDEPWVSNIYFIADQKKEAIYWLSKPQRWHSEHIAEQPMAAFAAMVEPDVPVIGVQGAGPVVSVKDEAEVAEVIEQYLAKYNKGHEFLERFRTRSNKHHMYRMHVTQLQLFDERNEKTAPIHIL